MRFAHLSRFDYAKAFQGSVKTAGRAAVAGVLCVLMVEQPILADARPTRTAKATAASAQLAGDERVLHALNRLTFGPRPGEVAEVEAMGLKAWFERQLNPAAIDDSALETKLALFPAMQMPQKELMERYPGGQTLRRLERSGGALPADPIEHAIYKDELAFYKKAKAKQEAAQVASAAPAAGMVAADGMEAASASGNGLTDQNKVADQNKMAEPAPAGMAAATAKKKKGNTRVDLLGDGSAMAKKKGSDGDAMAMEAGKAVNDASGADDRNFTGRGKERHDERFYPEAKTQAVLSLEPQARLMAILSLEPEELIAFRRSLSQAEVVDLGQGLNPLQRETLAALQGSARLVGGEILQTRMLRDVYSDRQLEAVMTDFWLNHFNVYIRKNQEEPYYLPAYEREVIRPNALGNFETLLMATAKSPAMLTYLDNFQSVGPDSPAAVNGPKYADKVKNPQVKQALKDRGLNENYARELMELHTVGVQCEVSKDRPVSMLPKACGQGYTQADVTQVAKVLTGWTIDSPYGAQVLRGRFAQMQMDQPEANGFVFRARTHEPGDKQVLGVTIPEGGQAEGLRVLHMLANSPATAHFISYKLAVRFVSDAPPPALVDRMAKSFLDTHGDIKTVLRTMFNAPEFWSPAVYRAKVKTPEEFVISAVRASGATVNNATPLVQALNQLGMGFYGMQTPNGYSWMSEPWVSTGALVSRMNFALVLSGNRLNGTRTNWPAVLGHEAQIKPVNLSVSGEADDAAAVAKERTLELALMGQPVSDRTRETVLKQSENTAAPEQAARNFAAQAAGGGMADAASETPATGSFLTGDMARSRGGDPQMDRQAAVIAGLLLGSPEFQRR